MADLSRVLQLLDEVANGITGVIDSVNNAQAHFQRISKGAGSNLLTSATQRCQRAPHRFKEGMDEVRRAQDLVGRHLVAVATAGMK
jgi:hypothetical protein